jgi:putative tricarboxylic transport membrane protein
MLQKLSYAAAFAAAVAFAPVGAIAQEGPPGDIEITVGSGAGATPDVMMRRVAKVLNETGIVTQPIVVTNRPGGSWTVVSNYVLSQEGNQNLMVTINPTIMTTPIVQNLPNTYEKLTPVAMLMRMNLVVVERADGPDADLAALVKRVKEGGERSVAFGGANVGTTDHIVASLIDKASGIKFNYVPFDGGGGPLMSAFLGGSVEVIVLTLDEAFPLLEGKKAKPLAVLSDERIDIGIYKDVPTAKEQGVDVTWGAWYGIAGAPGMKPEIVKWWDDKFAKMVETEQWKKEMETNFLVTDYVPSSGMKPVLDQIYNRFLTVLRELQLAKK